MKIKRRRRYATVYLDPPWPERGGGKIKRGADKHYPTMTVTQITLIPIDLWAAWDCHLYLWVTNNYMKAGFDVLDAWGFRYVTTITWMKDRIGLGQYYRGLSEHCLFAVRGKIPYQLTPEGKRRQGVTCFYAPKSRVHSEKPAEMRRMIELVSPGPRIELFARARHQGWDGAGFDFDGRRI